mmetsp:Transcript_32794/g.97853  ORF Transcript_32794/g.97853 Transcript_32794/m.97853 type:complete len:115 (-) Transcript_32794:14-358(-)
MVCGTWEADCAATGAVGSAVGLAAEAAAVWAAAEVWAAAAAVTAVAWEELGAAEAGWVAKEVAARVGEVVATGALAATTEVFGAPVATGQRGSPIGGLWHPAETGIAPASPLLP